MTRDEYLTWAKNRALEYLDRGDVVNAIASIGYDLSKHDEFKGAANSLMPMGLFYAMNRDELGARQFIEGFR
jgi:hypothetical protein